MQGIKVWLQAKERSWEIEQKYHRGWRGRHVNNNRNDNDDTNNNKNNYNDKDDDDNSSAGWLIIMFIK